MAIQEKWCSFVLFVLVLSLSGITAQQCNPRCKAFPPYKCNNTALFNRKDFPNGFFFGTATSAYQIEGAENRSTNIWDSFTHRYPYKTDDRSNGDIACDSLHLWEKDIELMKQMNTNAYRFSIAWSRVLPKGTRRRGIDENGIKYYTNLIDQLVANGITPFVTLFHWDLPQTLEDEYDGFLSERIVEDFKDFVDLCFERFGDKVKNWITLNQPFTVATKGYSTGINAPGRCTACDHGNSATEPYIVAHNQLLAHAAAVKLYREKYKPEQKGQIGVTLIGRWFNPLNVTSPEDQAATQRAFDFHVGWFLDPIYKGDYPESMKRIVGARLPQFTLEQSIMVRGSNDFLGINYYVTQYASNVPPPYPLPEKSTFDTDLRVKLGFTRDGQSIGPTVDGFTYYPIGFREILTYLSKNYNNPIIYITENGLRENGLKPRIDQVNDPERIEYQCAHLACLKCAMDQGARVRGYFVWSLMDNFEFNAGFTARFGLNYVNFTNPSDRQPKASARWYKNFLEHGRRSVM